MHEMNGYAGQILRLNLTERKVSAIATKDYEQWGGGHGIGSALFWDLVADKTIKAFDPRNVVTMMTSPLAGTLAPGAASRVEVQGIGPQSYPMEWFTRSNFGGRFGAMLKYAGWDGIVIEGRADKPVWVDIRNGDVSIKDASDLWGLDTWETQKHIWQEVGGEVGYGGWVSLGSTKSGGESTQRPAVVAIGPAGENLCRVACLIHDAGHASGQGGFGAVWGSKNLKAISVIGTGSIDIADPNALMEARLWSKKYYAFDSDDPVKVAKMGKYGRVRLNSFGYQLAPGVFWKWPQGSRPSACMGCHAGCYSRYDTGLGNEAKCITTLFYSEFDSKRHSGIVVRAVFSLLERFEQKGAAVLFNMQFGKQTSAAYIAADLLQKYGINAYELYKGLKYIRELNRMGVLGPGKRIDCDLPFDKLGSTEFVEKLLRMITYRQGIGDDMAEGFFRAAKNWGRLNEDLETGLLAYPYWGLPDHWPYDPRTEIEWGYGSILGDRDINEHDFNFLYWLSSLSRWVRKEPPITAEAITKIFSEKLIPYEGDPLMLDYSTENMYSGHIAKLAAWHRHYTRFWKQSVLYCNFLFPDFYNRNTPDKRGLTGDGEPKFYNAVTGKNLSFVDGMQVGRKIWNLDNAIWTLQGRHRDMVHFANYIYKVPFKDGSLTKSYMPGRKDGKWAYISLNGRCIDKARFEEWKTEFYKLEGWDPNTGWPRRDTLESIGIGYVADELERKGKLGIA